MALRLLQFLATTHTPEARRVVGQASTIILIVTLAGIVILCCSVVLLLRRRAHAQDRPADDAPAEPTDAWVESAKRMALEENDDIPREPGTA